MSLLTAKQPAEAGQQDGRVARSCSSRFNHGLKNALLANLLATIVFVFLNSAGTYAAAQNSPTKTPAILLLKSQHTNKIYQRRNANYELRFRLWLEAIQRQELKFRVITDRDLERTPVEHRGVLVLPGSIALSDLELKAIQRFVQSGGGLLIGGASGTLDNKGKWRSWDFVKQMAFLDDIQVLKKRDYKTLHVTMIGGSPITANIPAGLRIENVFYSENYAGISEKQEAYWSKYLQPLYAPDHKKYYTAIRTARYGRGRVCWFGFNLESMSYQPEHQSALLTLFGNTLRWLNQQAIAQVGLWPVGKKMAASLTFDCENDFENLTNLFKRPALAPLRFTFFMLSSIADQFPELVRQATILGEVAIHGDDHSIFRRQSYETQYQRLARAKEKLQALSRTEIISFRPPLQEYDQNTLMVLQALGLRNLFSDYTNSSVPHMQPVISERMTSSAPGSKAGLVVSMPRPSYDDYDLFVDSRLSNDAALDRVFEDLNRVILERGHYVLNMHTTAPWGGLTRNRIRVLSTLMHYLRQSEDFWTPTIREAADWSVQRSGLEVKFVEREDKSSSLTLVNHNAQIVENVVLEVFLPDSGLELNVNRAGSTSPLNWSIDNSEERLTIRVDALQPHEKREYILAPRRDENKVRS